MRRHFFWKTVALFVLLLVCLTTLCLSPMGAKAATTVPNIVHHKISVDPGSVVNSTRGSIATTVYGRGLTPKELYTLTDTNTSCTDTINSGATVMADLDGRFSYPLAGGPFYFDQSAPCTAGSYTVTAKSASGTAYSAMFKVVKPRLVTPSRVAIVPYSVVLTTDGSFSTSLYVRGLPPDKVYRFTDNVSCTDDVNELSPPDDIELDDKGNANIVLFGGPALISTSQACRPGTYTMTLTSLSNSTTYTAKFVLKAPRP